jgi:dienelactone hydrolase
MRLPRITWEPCRNPNPDVVFLNNDRVRRQAPTCDRLTPAVQISERVLAGGFGLSLRRPPAAPRVRRPQQAGFDTLAKQSLVDASRIALIGYCFGGTVGVEFGSTGAPLAANVAIHGSFGGHASGWAKNAKGMFLILHGAEDPNYPVEFGHVIDEPKAAKTPFEVELYSGTAHGFSQPKDKAEERAISQAKATTGRTLKELFGV